MANNSFIIIPVPMIRRLIETPNAYNELLAYGLYKSARMQRTSFENGALKQMIYCYYREQTALTESLRKWLQESEGEEWWPDEDYNGFNGATFNPDYEINFLWEICQKDNDLKEEIWEWYDLYQFSIIAGIKTTGVSIQLMSLYGNKFPSYDGEPYAMVSPRTLLQYRDKYSKERDRVRFAMLLSVCSIIGKARFKGTTKSQITMRMFGAKSNKELDGLLENEQLRAMYDQYTTRKMFDGMKNELLKMKLLKCYHGYAGRAYVSNRYELKAIVQEIIDFVLSKTEKEKVASWKENDRIFKEALNEKLTALNKRTS